MLCDENNTLWSESFAPTVIVTRTPERVTRCIGAGGRSIMCGEGRKRRARVEPTEEKCWFAPRTLEV